MAQHSVTVSPLLHKLIRLILTSFCLGSSILHLLFILFYFQFLYSSFCTVKAVLYECYLCDRGRVKVITPSENQI
jgi:hypothetical protein